MTPKYLPLTDALYAYVVETTAETPLQARLREETAALPEASMQIATDQGRFLAWLVALLGARRALEVGTFTGYSALAVAQALPSDGRLVACDVSKTWTAIARRYWAEAGVAERIDLRLGPARNTLDALITAGESGRFDFAFIDADKGNYDVYYERALRLLRPGGVIAVDNVLWGGSVVDAAANDADTAAIRALNAKIAADPRVDAALLTIADGVMLARKIAAS